MEPILKFLYEVMSREWTGMLGTLFILASMCCNCRTKRSKIWMRVLNLLGSVIFVVYGIILPSYTTALLNIGLVFVNLIYLIENARS